MSNIPRFLKSLAERLGIVAKTKELNKGLIDKNLIKEFLPEKPVIVEAGAHIGIDTNEMYRFWPGCTIYAFEPVPELYERLKKNTAGLKNVICYPLALSNMRGTAKMFVSSGSSDGSSSLLLPKEHLSEHPDVIFDAQVDVKTVTLDDWARENNIKRVDFLWLDLQGHELAVLQSATKVLETVSAIHTEVSIKEMYVGGHLYCELSEWLKQNGFFAVKEELPWPDMGNVLFVKQPPGGLHTNDLRLK
jgi:FkbM family methyltransferase